MAAKNKAPSVVVLLTVHQLFMGQLAYPRTKLNKASPTLEVCVLINDVDRSIDLNWAKGVTSLIFADAGVRIKWRCGEPDRWETPMPILINLTSHTPDELLPGALAYARVFEGVHIRIFLDRLRPGATDPRVGTFLLAHVMAHEITHILEGTDRHSGVGVMKCRWSSAEINRMTVKPLLLAPEDVKLIHHGLLLRQSTAFSMPGRGNRETKPRAEGN